MSAQVSNRLWGLSYSIQVMFDGAAFADSPATVKAWAADAGVKLAKTQAVSIDHGGADEVRPVVAYARASRDG
ncbi:MAG: hypothetical protein P8P20_15885 [Acidimicrobiales bacterium]|nr:hypothetical protein [Acidimicrobiales bacterium]